MKGRSPTKKESEWMKSARKVGCICCILNGETRPYEVPEEYTAIHHIEGKTKPGAHFLTIPLCPAHHQHGRDAIHVNRPLFEVRFGKEKDLIHTVRNIINEQA